MEMEQEMEWLEAQKTVISLDLVAAARQQLLFLAAVDRNRWLYEGPTLQKAIYRYKACWLPLLAKHSESPISEESLVVPLDCEWIWHCHRLNPVRYKSDCEELYGKILDNSNVVSSVQGTCTRQTENIWNRLYPEEPYIFELTKEFSGDISKKESELEKCTRYNLVSAVERQSPFFYQVSTPHMNNDLFLEGAVARYKGFLHLIKRNRERSIRRFCVPTYDIDLIWHTHQLHPVSYCKDLNEALGKVLEHDDMDSDRTKGKKLDLGFSGTTKQWEETFGTRYWRAGAMYRGSSPSPLKVVPSNIFISELVASSECQKIFQLPQLKSVEVFLEIVGVRNLPEGHKGNLSVSFSKTQPDVFFTTKKKISILSESREKQVTSFQCEPTGELIFELISHSSSTLPITKTSKVMGYTSLSLKNFLDPVTELSVEKWVVLVPSSGDKRAEPICLRIAVSFTIPSPAPRVLHIIRPQLLSKTSCFFPLPLRSQHTKSWTRVIDETEAEFIGLQMRESKGAEAKSSFPRKEVIGMTKSSEIHTLAEFVGTGWSLRDPHTSLQLQKKFSEDGHYFELVGSKMVKIFPGRKLEYEPKYCEKHRSEKDFLTAVEFSAEDPYGKAVALLNMKSGILKVREEWLVLPGVISAFIIDRTLKEGCDGLPINGDSLQEMSSTNKQVNVFDNEDKRTITTSIASEVQLNVNKTNGDAAIPEKVKLDIGGCGSGCRNVVEIGGSGQCGSGCGSGCGHMVKSSGCGGSGCGSGCGHMVKSSGCRGSGCGSGCGHMVSSGGNMMNSGGCGAGGCGSGCGNMVNSGGCGAGGCGSGCGNMVNSGENLVNSGGCGGCGAGGCGSGCGQMMKSSGCGAGGCGGCGAGCCSSDLGGKSSYEENGSGIPGTDEQLEEAVVV